MPTLYKPLLPGLRWPATKRYSVFPYDINQEEVPLKAILGNRPDGIILTGTHHNEEIYKRLLNIRIPIVEAWDITSEPLDTLMGFSHRAVGQTVGEYLLAKGHGNFAAIIANDRLAIKRFSDFAATLRDAGIDSFASHKCKLRPDFKQGAKT